MLRDMAFSRLQKKIGYKSGKKLMDTAKTSSKRVVRKTVETKGDLIGNKITDKITSVQQVK